MLVAMSLAVSLAPLPTVPGSIEEMVERAADAVNRAASVGVKRQLVRLMLPDDRTLRVLDAVEISDDHYSEELDTWTDSLTEQFPVALELGREMLRKVTGAPEDIISDHILDAEDACGLVLAQGETPAEDTACMIFAGCNQIDQLARVDELAGHERLVCLLNPQFTQLDEFNWWEQAKARAIYFDRGYEVVYAFEQFACRGEDVQLVCEFGLGWRAFVSVDGQSPESIPLHDGYLRERPTYLWLEDKLNEQNAETGSESDDIETDDDGVYYTNDDDTPPDEGRNYAQSSKGAEHADSVDNSQGTTDLDDSSHFVDVEAINGRQYRKQGAQFRKLYDRTYQQQLNNMDDTGGYHSSTPRQSMRSDRMWLEDHMHEQHPDTRWAHNLGDLSEREYYHMSIHDDRHE